MKKIIHGTLRLFLALGGIYMLHWFFSKDVNFSGIKSGDTGEYIGVFVVGQLLSCFILYMGINGIRDFMRKRIRLRLMYVVSAVMCIIILLMGFLGKGDNSTDAKEPPSDWDFLYLLALMAIVYFMIADFITLFIKSRKKKVFTDEDYSTQI